MKTQTLNPDFSAVQSRHVLVALSGGADSVALLLLLRDAGVRVTAVHVEHGLRGEASLRDADFCVRLCTRLDVPCVVVHVDVPGECARTGEGSETVARCLRYAALRRIQAEVGADCIALAHHRDDQAETVLMHLLRGCGLNGAAGMRMFADGLYRPLLGIPKAELTAYCRARGVSFCEDATNLVDDNPRNALRLKVFPLLRTLYPGADKALTRFAHTAAEEDAYLERLTRDTEARYVRRDAWGVTIRGRGEIEAVLLKRLLRRYLGANTGYEKIEELAMLQGRGEADKHTRVFGSPSALYLLKKEAPVFAETALMQNGETVFHAFGTMTAAPAEPVAERNHPYIQVLDAASLEGCVLRFRKNGDRMRPLGCGDRLLSDVLSDRKLDAPLRDRIPLVCKGNRVLWAVGIGIAEEARLTEETRQAVRLIWHNNKGEQLGGIGNAQ